MKKRTLVVALAFSCWLPALAFAASTSMHPLLGAKLTGKVEVPKGALAGKGLVNLNLSAGKGTVCWTFSQISGIGTPSAAHIHKGAPGKAGAVVVPLGTAYKAKGCTSASKKLIEAIESNPNSYYVNVHTSKYPAGAIRGQLVSGMVHM